MINQLLIDIIEAIYQPLLFALILGIMGLLVFSIYKNKFVPSYHITKDLIYLLKDKYYRNVFYLIVYITLIVFKTLLNRGIWMHPLSNILGPWNIYVYTIEIVENLLLFMPYTYFINRIKTISIGKSILYTFYGSIVIECLQLILKLGTFQLSDIFFNTLGGCIISIIFQLVRIVKISLEIE